MTYRNRFRTAKNLTSCLAKPHVFCWGRKPEQTGIALDRVRRKASQVWVTKGMDSCVLFSIPRPFFPLSPKDQVWWFINYSV